MKIDILTLFPEAFAPLFCSIPQRAQDAGLVELAIHDLRAWGKGKHKQVDDAPYGGGAGMVMACPPIVTAVREILAGESGHVIHLTPQGRPLTQARVLELAARPRLLLLCGHYEGIDERVTELVVNEEVAVGDFVVSGGELPAMMLADAVIRTLPGAIAEDSVRHDSFYDGLLDHAHYTRPAEFEGLRVPEVLLSGDHKKIEEWRRQTARERTRARRPDLFESWLKCQEPAAVRRSPRDGKERSKRREQTEAEPHSEDPGGLQTLDS